MESAIANELCYKCCRRRRKLLRALLANCSHSVVTYPVPHASPRGSLHTQWDGRDRVYSGDGRSCCSYPREECFKTQFPFFSHDQNAGEECPIPKERNATETTPCLKGGNVWKYTFGWTRGAVLHKEGLCGRSYLAKGVAATAQRQGRAEPPRERHGFTKGESHHMAI